MESNSSLARFFIADRRALNHRAIWYTTVLRPTFPPHVHRVPEIRGLRMPIPAQPVDIAKPLSEATVPLAADGFPIDQSLQRRARRAAIGYGLLALYYVCMTPFVLRFIRWGTLRQIADDLL